MADSKVSALTDISTNLSSDDLLYVVNDPGGTPASRKATVSGLSDYLMYATLPFMFGDSSGINPADATTYHFGFRPNFDPPTSTETAWVQVAPFTGVAKAFAGSFQVVGTLGSAGSSTLTLSNLSASTTQTISSSLALTAATNPFSVTGLSLAVTAGDKLELTWLTPTWATNPTTVYFLGNLLVKVV